MRKRENSLLKLNFMTYESLEHEMRKRENSLLKLSYLVNKALAGLSSSSNLFNKVLVGLSDRHGTRKHEVLGLHSSDRRKALRQSCKKWLSKLSYLANKFLVGLSSLSRPLSFMFKKVSVGLFAVMHASLCGFGLSEDASGQAPQPTSTPQLKLPVVNQYPPPRINNVPTALATSITAKDIYILHRAGVKKTYNALDNDGNIINHFAEKAGDSCRQGASSSNVGKSVNVMTGNMCLEQSDYRIAGSSGALDLNRFYNTVIQTDGLFGKGWQTQFDESLVAYGDTLVRVNMADGRAVYFERKDTTTSTYTISAQKPIGEVVKEADGSYLLKLKDGHESKLTSAGRLEWKKDRNGNQTTLTYDANGNLTKVTDAFGRSLNFTMSGGRVTRVSDALGKVADYVYNADGTLQSVTYADNSKYQFEYTSINNKKYMTAVKDALNNILESHSYDEQGRAITSERHGGVDKQTISYGHTTSGGNTYARVTDGLGRITRYNYKELSGLKLLMSVEGNCGCGSGEEKTSYRYDNKLNVIKKTNALRSSTTYTYDAEGNVLTQVLGILRYTYNKSGQVLMVRHPGLGTITTNTYDAKGNLLTTKDALNNTTTLTYTTKGQIATVTDARNNTTTFAYDALGRLTRVTDADNKSTNYAYDARSRLTSITNALNEKTSYTYDVNNRLKRITYPDANYREFTYDLAGRRTRFRDEKGNITSFTYDNAYRLTQVKDALNNTTSYSYDLMSNITSVTNGVGKTTNYEYDNFDRLKKIIYPAASTGATRLEERYEYDAAGNLVKHIDTANRQTSYEYNNLYRLKSETNALMNSLNTALHETSTLNQETNSLNQKTTYGYEYIRNDGLKLMRTTVTDSKNQTYILEYDVMGRLRSEARGDWKTDYIYDAVGNMTKRVDYTNRVTNYTYDKLNRLTRISYLGNAKATVTYTYDALGRMLTATNNTGTVTFTYDNRGRLVSENDVHNQTVRYGYEANGNRSSLSLNGSNHTTYAYDVVNRLTSLTSAADKAQFRYSYDKADRLTSKVLPNGITTTYAYDGMSRLTKLKDATSVKTHYDRKYTYNTASQISQITELAKTRNLEYDPLNRLTKMTSPTVGVSAESYWYDSVGNRTASHKSVGYRTKRFNKLEEAAGADYTYDLNGNMTSKTSGGVTWIYKWDFENRMTEANNGKIKVKYEYDGLGRRVKRIRRSGTPVVKPIVPVPNCNLTVSATSVAPGAGVDASWALSPSSKKARLSKNGWLRLYEVGDDNSASAWWEHEAERARGSMYVQMPNFVGDYEFRYFSSDGVTKLATSPKVSVSAAKLEKFELRLPSKWDKRSDYWNNQRKWFVLGEKMKISWQASQRHVSATDWIGLYKVMDLNTAVPQWRQNTGGGTVGSLSVKLPSTAGNYAFRYFSGTGITRKATSSTIRVVDPASYQLTPSATSVKAEATMSISWQLPLSSTGGGGEYDWIGLYKVGDSDTAVPQRRRQTIRSVTGSFQVDMPRVAGDYEFRYFLDSGFFDSRYRKKVATSATVKVEATSFELIIPEKLVLPRLGVFYFYSRIIKKMEKLFVPGESVEVLWQAPPGQTSATDWIGLYKVGELDTAVAQWKQNTDGGTVGSFSVKMPSAAGDYEFRYFSNNTNKATSRKLKVVDTASYKLEVSATSVASEGRIGMLWEAPLGHKYEEDWVGLYKVGELDTAVAQWKQNTGGGTVGSFSVKMPSAAGKYEFRYFLGSGDGKRTATSAAVTVRASAGSGVGKSKSSSRQRREVIKYTYDGWDVIREDSSVNGVTTYLQDCATCLHATHRQSQAGQNGLGMDDKLRSKNGTTVRYFLKDHLGSTEALADSNGAITSSTSYDSFGNATSNIATSYRYTGREYDSDTELYYYRNRPASLRDLSACNAQAVAGRWYDPEIGRFISEGSIGFGGDVNLYGYVGNNPQNFVDPSGNYACGSRSQKRQKGVYPGENYNKVEQLAPRLKLNVPEFGEVTHAPRTLLENKFGEAAEKNIISLPTIKSGVCKHGGRGRIRGNRAHPQFKKFYKANYGCENGIYVEGLKVTRTGRNEIGGGGFFQFLTSKAVGASVEFEKGHIDVDLYHPHPAILT